MICTEIQVKNQTDLKDLNAINLNIKYNRIPFFFWHQERHGILRIAGGLQH